MSTVRPGDRDAAARAAPTANSPLAIVGTAGHIDHGKTALVKRLTGVDTDRLPEEKARGISIDLGFARLVTPNGVQVGLIDVPGHERFVKNMLAGAGGIDVVLLVIAADEGVMPQTREHFAIVQMLDIRRGVVVLTKSDRVEAEWLELVRRDVTALLAATSLATAEIVAFSAVTGAGQPELLAALDRALAGIDARELEAPARLAVDRVFTVEGFGTVVTGTLWRGRIATGETLELSPAGRAVRVRRVQVHGETVEHARAGQRTAIALHGVEKEQVERGDWLIAAGSLVPSRTVDVRFELLADAGRAWPAVSRVRFHLGAAETLGRLVMLEGRELSPGESALAQMRLEVPIVAARGDRFVVRAYSPSRTIGGGSVIEPLAERRKRGTDLAALAVRETGSLEARLLERLGHEPRPTHTAVLAQGLGESEAAVREALAALLASEEVVAPSDSRWLAPSRWNEARAAIEGEVGTYADRWPGRFGVMKGDLKSGLKSRLDAALFDAAFDALVTDGHLELRGERVRPGDRPWEPPAELVRVLEQLERELDAAGYLVPEIQAAQAKVGADGSEAVALGYFSGRLVRVSHELTYTAAQMESLRAKLVAWFDSHAALTVADLRELTGASRKYAVPLLEHSDRVRWTVRVGDERRRGER
ncbi:MAG: selenocysteine-specific translation elongation factor, partial [Candidatus Eisenbacteria bacterium]|nr:selenocysteine-specific translation elongation factor [Candidatus Eisenbacteria bacterium]